MSEPEPMPTPQMVVRQGAVSNPDETEDEETEEEVPPERIAYLTIDDGPSESVTLRILDVLQEEGVKATFFVLPYQGVDHIYERILTEGHAMGNHSYSHDYKQLYGADDGVFFREDVQRAKDWMEEQFGHQTDLFRFPGGSQSWDRAVIERRREILDELGYRVFDWDVSTGDTAPGPTSKDPKALISNVMGRTAGRDSLIVLMHDTASKGATAEALPEIIAQLRAEGYGFDTLEHYERPQA